MIVDIFIPCFIDQLYPDTALNMVKILEKYGIGVNYNPEQTCCGQIAFKSGFWNEARSIAIKFLKDFSNDRYIVSPSPSCVGMIKNYYNEFFYNSAFHNDYKQVQKNIYEFTDFMVNILKVGDNTGAIFNETVTYHDSCSSLREINTSEQARELLKHVKGLKLVEMEESDVCCGFGYTFSVKNEAISTAMAQQKIQNAINTGASYIVSSESSCLMHLDAYIEKHKLPIKTIHIVDVLASGWE